ncbi:hypothetical protein CDCA_CDCA13G3612 [Cyanidium caldarium]|uniref:Glutamate--cysteine ligase n=1 Tax=Cyanidium caldarium TaxID=2771 RepID=A0AAV9IZ22_CYACA|nr:hypothetical protein CDCA_CDCA13G3612 [Cyanidium caldarium]
MGLLASGRPLTWWDAIPHLNYVRQHGVEQFLNVYWATRNRQGDVLKWGDEIEYTVVVLDDVQRVSYLSLRAPEIIAELQRAELAAADDVADGAPAPVETLWRPEYANWMVEGTPGEPYACYVSDLMLVEKNMMLRREQIQQLLRPEEHVVSVAGYPRIGCGVFTRPSGGGVCGPLARSLYLPDAVINPHPRFGTLTRNIRLRRGGPVDIRMPLYRDAHTPARVPVWEGGERHGACVVIDGAVRAPLDDRIEREEHHREEVAESTDGWPAATASPVSSAAVAVRDPQSDVAQCFCRRTGLASIEQRCADGPVATDSVYMDAMGFGMGLSCLQLTLQAANMDEGRWLYDQLAVLAPIMLALTAATPALRGWLLDTDVRWDVISAAVDDRTPEEIARQLPPKSRYSSADCFISTRPEMKPELYNDVPVPIDPPCYERLLQGGVDERLARHIAHLFIRDPLVVFDDCESVDDRTSMVHFENIQSTNWNTVRFKPPPSANPRGSAGWRTEFRPMEVQLTDFENAAFTVFMVLLSRCILAFGMNLYIPVSRVDANMGEAHRRGAVREGRFWFRKHVFAREVELSASVSGGYRCACGETHQICFSSMSAAREGNCLNGGSNRSGKPPCCGFRFCADPDPDATDLMSVDEIMNGKPCCEKHSYRNAYPGLIPLARAYLDAMRGIDSFTRHRLGAYLDFVSARASGRLQTCAEWMRHFIEAHPGYAKDSRISAEVCYDLMSACVDIADGNRSEPALLGEFWPKHMMARGISSQEFSELRTQQHDRDSPMLRGESFVDGFHHAAATTLLGLSEATGVMTGGERGDTSPLASPTEADGGGLWAFQASRQVWKE